MRKDRLDGVGFATLIGVAGILAANQIIIKIVDQGLQPVFRLSIPLSAQTPP